MKACLSTGPISLFEERDMNLSLASAAKHPAYLTRILPRKSQD